MSISVSNWPAGIPATSSIGPLASELLRPKSPDRYHQSTAKWRKEQE